MTENHTIINAIQLLQDHTQYYVPNEDFWAFDMAVDALVEKKNVGLTTTDSCTNADLIKSVLERKIEKTADLIQTLNDKCLELEKENQKSGILHSKYLANKGKINCMERDIAEACANVKTLREVMYIVNNIIGGKL